MSQINEIDAITALENALSQVEDPATRDRVLKWAWDKYASKLAPAPDISAKTSKPVQINSKKKSKSSVKTKTGSSIVKELNLKPEDKLSFRDFAQNKQPKTNQEKCTVAVYYLCHELGITGVTINHVHTCFKDMNWRLIDFANNLYLTASIKGWVDTSNMENITITTIGENLIELDLPHKSKGE